MRQSNGKLVDPPAAASERPEVEPTVQQVHERPGVLVVDDEHFVRSILQLGLARSGFNVWLASNGQEAVDLYREHRADIGVVLLDVRMPGLDGPATLDALRHLNPDVLACFMSGDMGNYEPEDLRRGGPACAIAKPFHLDDLANILRLLTQGMPADLLPFGGHAGGELRET
jgi:CheY-like chemotaxis protein